MSGLTARHRAHPLWYAFLLHRVSGLLLALFLPVHFMVLAQSMTDPQGFSDAIEWTQRPLVKVAEFGLVFLLSVHLFGGLRLLVLELTAWQPWQKGWVAAAAAGAFAVACLFLLSAL